MFVLAGGLYPPSGGTQPSVVVSSFSVVGPVTPFPPVVSVVLIFPPAVVELPLVVTVPFSNTSVEFSGIWVVVKVASVVLAGGAVLLEVLFVDSVVVILGLSVTSVDRDAFPDEPPAADVLFEGTDFVTLGAAVTSGVIVVFC